MRQLILVRHGQTVANTEKRWQGQRFDGKLTALGRRQIEAVAQRLASQNDGITALYTSPLRRTLETAQGIGRVLGLTPGIKDDLREMDFGELDSWTMADIAEKRPEFFNAWLDKHNRDLVWPGGESRREFASRVFNACKRIIERHPQETVAIVAHGGTLAVGIAQLLEWPLHIAFSYRLSNCGLTRLVYQRECWLLWTLNDTCHLPKGEEYG